VVDFTLRPLYPEKGLIVQKAGWASGPIWTGKENLTPTGILFPDLPNASVVTAF
jgi:hypothetical protein